MASELPDRPFLAYLTQLNEDVIASMHQSEVCCLFIYRILPPLAQQCIAAMVFNSNFNILDQCGPEQLTAIKDNIELLQKLKIAQEGSDDCALNDDFRFNYLKTTVKGLIKTNGINSKTDLDHRSQKTASKDLYQKAIERWECVLSYLALPSETSMQNVSPVTRDLFQHIGFTRQSNNDLEITSLGFQFLLLGRTEQVWTYLIYHFKFVEVHQSAEDLFRLLEFFFRLSLCVTPIDVSERSFTMHTHSSNHMSTPLLSGRNWSESVQKFLLHLRELGLVFIRKRKDGYFFLTPLFSSIVASDNLLAKDHVVDASRDRGFLVTETNYRISAYTNSNLHLSILSTFTRLLHRFDNFVVAIMTRETVQEAFQVGITARQITQFLRSNAHYKTIQTHGQLHCVPPTVINQIHLWEEERDRLKMKECVMYSMFSSEKEYIGLRNFVTEQGILLYDDRAQKTIVVIDEGHEQVKKWYSQQPS